MRGVGITRGFIVAQWLMTGMWFSRFVDACVMVNRDVRAETPLANLFVHDFWGEYIGHTESHKSYRPLTVLTFRYVTTVCER